MLDPSTLLSETQERSALRMERFFSLKPPLAEKRSSIMRLLFLHKTVCKITYKVSTPLALSAGQRKSPKGGNRKVKPC